MKFFNSDNLIRISIFFFAISLTFMTFSCKKAAEKTHEKLIEQAIGEDADVDLEEGKMVIETEEGKFITDASAKSWPAEIPDHIPEFTEGKIIMVNTQQMTDVMGWVIVFEEVPENVLNKYKDELTDKGFTTKMTTLFEDKGNVIAEKEDWIVSIMAGEGMATVSVSKEK